MLRRLLDTHATGCMLTTKPRRKVEKGFFAGIVTPFPAYIDFCRAPLEFLQLFLFVIYS